MVEREPGAPVRDDALPFPTDWPVARYAAILRTRLPELRERYGITYLGLFGSYVRNDQGPDSDLDVLVEFDKPLGLFEFVHMQNEMSDALGVEVDLVRRRGLKPTIGLYILREVVEL